MSALARAWQWCTAWPRGFVGYCHTAICALTTEEGRKGWAMLAALGCTIESSLFAAASLWLVRKNPWFAFWLGMAAMIINVIVVTGLMVLLGIRRDLEADLKEGKVKIDDGGDGVTRSN